MFFLLVDDHWDANSHFRYQACLALQVARTPRSCSGSSDFFMLLRKCAKNDCVCACNIYACDDVGILRVNFGNMILFPLQQAEFCFVFSGC